MAGGLNRRGVSASRWQRGLRGGVLLVLLPAFSVVILFGAVQELPYAWAVHQGEGVSGVFRSEQMTCGRHSCTSSGTFVGDDGSRRSTVLEADRAVPAGESVVARDVGDPDRVYIDGGDNAWLRVILSLGVGIVFLAVSVSQFAQYLRRRRGPPAP